MGKKKGDGGAAALRDEAKRQGEIARSDISQVELPEIAAMELALKNPELVGLLEAEQLDPTALLNVSTDPALREAQMQALYALQERGAEGLTEEDKIAFSQLARKVGAQQQSQQNQILQSLAERGMGGSGAELAARLQASQGGANLASEQAMQMAAASAQAKREALQQSGALANTMESTDWNRGSEVARAKDAIAQMNAQNRQSIAAQNLAAQQKYSDLAVNNSNTQQQYNKQLQQTQFENEMRKQQAKANAATNQAQTALQSASMVKPAAAGNLFSTVGTVGGAAAGAYFGAGNPAAISAGAALGGAVGGGVDQQRAEDGAIIKKFAYGGLNYTDLLGKKLAMSQDVSESGKLLERDNKKLLMPNSEPMQYDNPGFDTKVYTIGNEVKNRGDADAAINAERIKNADTSDWSSPEALTALSSIVSGLNKKKAEKEDPIYKAKFNQFNYEDGGLVGLQPNTNSFGMSNTFNFGLPKDWSKVYSGMDQQSQNYFNGLTQDNLNKYEDGGVVGNVDEEAAIKELYNQGKQVMGDLDYDQFRQEWDVLTGKQKFADGGKVKKPIILDKVRQAGDFDNVGKGIKFIPGASEAKGVGKVKWVDKLGRDINKLRKSDYLDKIVKKVPAAGMLAGLYAAMDTGDASAAIPILNEAEDLGPTKGSIGAAIEDPELQKQLTEEDMKRATLQEYACGGKVSKHNFEKGGIQDGQSYVGDRVDAKINSGEMVLNIEQQQRLMDLLKGVKSPEELPNKDIVEEAAPEETNLHEKNMELEARIAALEKLLTNR